MKNYLSVMVIISLVLVSIAIADIAKANDAEDSKSSTGINSGTEKMISTGSHNLSSVVYGNNKGPSVILFNGMRRDQSYWSPIIANLNTLATVFTYDSVGIGKSDKGAYPQSGDKEIADLKVLLEKRNIPKPYILVAHSFGGMYARLFAAAYPDDIAGLVLEDVTPVGLSEAILNVLEGDEKQSFSKFIQMTPPAMKKTEDLVKQSNLPQVPLIVLTAGQYNSLTRYDEATRERTRLVSRKLASEMAELIPGGREIVVQGVGHTIHSDKPQVVVQAIKEIIGKNTRSSCSSGPGCKSSCK